MIELAARGAAICIKYATRMAEVEAVVAEIAAADGRVIAIQADVADADAVARMVVRTEAELGSVSILVNNAGVSSPATLESYDPAAMARMRRVNVDGVIHTIRAVAPGMQERGYGRIVNIGSNAAIGTALPGTTFYAAEFQVRVRNMSERTMVGRAGRPDDIANAVAFLASPEWGFVTAQVIAIDGGQMDYVGHC